MAINIIWSDYKARVFMDLTMKQAFFLNNLCTTENQNKIMKQEEKKHSTYVINIVRARLLILTELRITKIFLELQIKTSSL
jgi:hypothetical protein